MANRLWQILMEDKTWQSDSYVCPKMAARYNQLVKYFSPPERVPPAGKKFLAAFCHQ